MKRRSFWQDSIFATICIFLLIWIFQSISQFNIFDAFDPIGEALSDVEFTDIAFSRIRKDPKGDTNIVLINIGELDRAGIGRQIEIITKYRPRVIGIDAFFNERSADTLGDMMLSNAIANAPNVVLVTKLLQTTALQNTAMGKDIYDSLERSGPFFRGSAREGFANLETEAVRQEDFKTCRRFPPSRSVNGEELKAFSVMATRLHSPEKTDRFLAREHAWEIINYRGNAADYFGRTRFPTVFSALDFDDVLNENFVPEMIEGKIVLFGYMGKSFFDTSWDDKFFTPLNKAYAGKTNPDTYGVVIHANIISMILSEDYIGALGDNQAFLLAIVLCLLNVILFNVIYHRLSNWYDGVTKLLQMAEILIFMFLMVMIFDWYNFKLDLTYSLIAIALAGDTLEVYHGVIKNLFTQKLRRGLFTIRWRKV